MPEYEEYFRWLLAHRAYSPKAYEFQESKRYLACGACLQDGSTALHYASAFGQAHVLEALVSAGCAVDARDNAHNTSLHLAAGAISYGTILGLYRLMNAETFFFQTITLTNSLTLEACILRFTEAFQGFGVGWAEG